jgi:alkanesulfonate monooxygenase SsuD/methylene tetrahydromethanopterin reductase-like flavin-dependent oxidoreductase (luciferase family)
MLASHAAAGPALRRRPVGIAWRAMEFGVFDHLDRSPSALADYYEERLATVELYDRAGFHGYHLAEHNFTPLGMAPSPSVFLAAVAQRTKRLRFGPMIYALPLYHPLRMIEEICMLDQMSGGRLDVGFGRGASPIELEMFGVNPGETRDIYEESLAIILKGLSEKTVSFKGKYFSYDSVPMELEPIQKPHPPVWYGVHANDSSARAAKRGLNVISLDGVAATHGFSDAYRAAWKESSRVGPMPKFGLGRMLVVADTDAEALRLAERAYPVWNASFIHLFKVYDRMPSHPRPPQFSAIQADGRGFCGSPKTVTEIIRRQMADSGADYFVGQFAFGDLTLKETLHSIELFAREVMPALRNVH